MTKGQGVKGGRVKVKSKGKASRTAYPSHANKREREGASELNHKADANERKSLGKGAAAASQGRT